MKDGDGERTDGRMKIEETNVESNSKVSCHQRKVKKKDEGGGGSERERERENIMVRCLQDQVLESGGF